MAAPLIPIFWMTVASSSPVLLSTKKVSELTDCRRTPTMSTCELDWRGATRHVGRLVTGSGWEVANLKRDKLQRRPPAVQVLCPNTHTHARAR